MIRQALVTTSTSYTRLAHALPSMHVTAVIVRPKRMTIARLAAVPGVYVPEIVSALVAFQADDIHTANTLANLVARQRGVAWGRRRDEGSIFMTRTSCND